MVVMNAHHPDLQHPVRPGSMGHAAPGASVAVLEHDRDVIAPPGTVGRVVIDTTDSALFWFDGYAGRHRVTTERYTREIGRWYVTGDVGSRDEAGYFSFSSRDDDVIIMAGYRIGPFEVESAIVEHPAVVEVAVIGVPDALRGEVIEAFVVLVPGATNDERVRGRDQATRQVPIRRARLPAVGSTWSTCSPRHRAAR